MALDLFINVDSPSVQTALRATVDAKRPANALEFPLGQNLAVNVYLIDAAGAYITPTGTAKLGLARKAKSPASGAFWISFNDEITEAIPYNAAQQDIEDALNILESITALGGVTVTGVATAFKITFKEAGVISHSFLLGLSPLSPRQTGLVSVIQAGDSEAQAEYFVQINAQILTLAQDFTEIENGLTTTLDLSTTTLLEALNSATEASVILEFKLGDEVLLQAEAIIRYDFINDAVFNDPVITGTYADIAIEAAQNALTYKNAAETAANNSLTYSQNSLNSQNAAATSAGLATDSANAAGASEDAANFSALSAAQSESNAASSEAEANNYAQQAGGYSSSAQDAALTATSQASLATTQATNAANSAVSASSSAATALNAIAQAFKGGLAGASVPATSTATGDTYRITSAGTSQGKTWAIGDAAIYNGSSGSWTQLTGFYAGATAYAEQLSSYKYTGPYIFSDGATTNRALIQTPGARGNLAGAPLASWVGWVEVPASNPASTTYIASLMGTTTPPGTQFNSLEIGIYTAGNLNIAVSGPTSRSNNRYIDWPAFRSTYSGQRIWLEVRFTFGASAPVVRVNGVNVSGNFNVFSTGTATDWLASTLDCTYHLTGFNWPSGTAPRGCWLNAHLTDAESESWRITGRPPAWVADGGSQVAAYVSNFTSGVDSWQPNSAMILAGVGGITLSGETNCAEFTITTAAASQIVRPSILSLGRKYRITGKIYSDTSSFFFGFGGQNNRVNEEANVSVAPGAWVDFSLTGIDPAQTGLRMAFFSTATGGGLVTLPAGAKFYLKNIQVTQLGSLSLLRPQRIAVADDWTSIGGNSARLVGMRGITEDPEWRIVTSTATNGNAQLLGGSLFLDTNRHRLNSWVINNLGPSGIASLGNVSAGTQYASSVSVPVGLTEITLATRFNATLNLWANSNTTGQLVHTIQGQQIGNN